MCIYCSIRFMKCELGSFLGSSGTMSDLLPSRTQKMKKSNASYYSTNGKARNRKQERLMMRSKYAREMIVETVYSLDVSSTNGK